MTGHPKAGQPTFFPEKVLNSLGISYRVNEVFLIRLNSGQLDKNKFATDLLAEFYKSLKGLEAGEKHHTMREGKRFKTGDKASLRVWSGKPYASPKIIIADDVELTVKDVEISGIGGWITIDGKEMGNPELLAMNDGLSETDLADWFKRKPFSGQLLIWNNNNLPY